MQTAYVSEIYSSVQGEGPYTGERQVFFRLAGCPLRCNYCDTPGSLTAQGHSRMSINEAVKKIAKAGRAYMARTVSITGGEPLAHAAFLAELLPRLRRNGFRIYLETAGVHPRELAALIGYCDVISMDIKLPSATGKKFWKEHKKFLRVSAGKAFVKLIVERKSKMKEIKQAVSLIGSARPPALLVLQPASPMPPLANSPTVEQIAAAFEYARSHLPRVLVMPQQQKIWKVR